MKKAGSSNSKSRTRRTSKSSSKAGSSRAAPAAAASSKNSLPGFNPADLAVGHRPGPQLAPQDEALFRAFQSNLLSLISHELRTPLTGILNSLSLLDDPDAGGEFTAKELISMARRNASRLQKTLSSLLDLAALDSGSFHARLREVELDRLVTRRFQSQSQAIEDAGLRLVMSSELERAAVLADPQKISRALDLCLDVALQRAQPATEIKVRISSAAVRVAFQLREGALAAWRELWDQSVAGKEGGVASPASAFSGALQSEQAFLSRMEEGLGSELLLVHEIMRAHQGRFGGETRREGEADQLVLSLEFPELSSEEGLRAVLSSRAYQTSTELGSVALAIIPIPEGVQPEELRQKIRDSLFRASDAVYTLEEQSQLALVMDDCKPEDAPRLIGRIEGAIGRELRWGLAACPADGFDPAHLLEVARRRLQGA